MCDARSTGCRPMFPLERCGVWLSEGRVIAVRNGLHHAMGNTRLGAFEGDMMSQTVRGQMAAVTRRSNVAQWVQIFMYSDCTNSCTQVY